MARTLSMFFQTLLPMLHQLFRRTTMKTRCRRHIEHAPPLFVRIREDKISLKISPAPLTGGLESCLATQVGSKAAPRPLRFCSNRAFRLVISCCTLLMRCHCLRPSFRLRRALLLLRRLLRGLLLLLRRLCCCGNWEGGLQRLFLGPL